MAEPQEAEVKETPAIGKGEGDKSKCRIIVQGGGYSSKISEHPLAEEYEKVTTTAAKTGYNVMMTCGTAVDAVEAAVSVFEKSTLFNAGRGSALNNFGEVECDALIMDGKTMNTGAVMAARRFINPVQLARKVMDESVHCALSGDGALEFAREIGFTIHDPEELKGENPNQKLRKGIGLDKNNYNDFVRYRNYGEPPKESKSGDTVCAVAMDDKGYFACAMSSGGIPGKLKGRVGDVPLVGCGGYANENGAAATTGHGESIMKMTLARNVVYNMENRLNAQKSSQKALDEMKKHVDGRGGVIAIDKDGNFGIAFNTEDMVWASIKDGELKFSMAPA